ncbi:ATPase P [Clostridia bacterium]|nr:ATPase P [Clostridia bacterium]
MLTRNIPGDKVYGFDYLVLDFNGTIAEDGLPCEGVKECIEQLSGYLNITVLTADTFGSVEAALDGWPVAVKIIDSTDQIEAKRNFVETLQQAGAQVIALGNGLNDKKMLAEADLALAVLGSEGLCTQILDGADLLVRSATEGLELLLNEKALSATLKS